MILTMPRSEELQKIIEGRHHAPYTVLGLHRLDQYDTITVFLPDASSASINGQFPLHAREEIGIFQWRGAIGSITTPYQIHAIDHNNQISQFYDPYAFPLQLAEFDLHLFSEGRHWHAYRFLGANPHTVNGINGTLFAVWAPNASRVSVVGDFNQWNGLCHPMQVHEGFGVWELFIPHLAVGSLYKFEIRHRESDTIHLKSDPYARQAELRPHTASVTTALPSYQWQDNAWLQQRTQKDWLHQPYSIYEVHLGSWQRDEENRFLNYRQLADQLIPYVKEMAFTHIELLPITEHPLDDSWGYQTTGYYAPTRRFGSPDDLRYFIDQCHQHHIGVLLDWVPGHFPKDSHGLARFDGSPLYEHGDPKQGEHQDWGTYIFNYDRVEVSNFLLANAIYWLEEFHFDGLRVDAVASMLYLDYSRQEGEWIPNENGGRENLAVIAFLKQLNIILHQNHPGCLVIAEESTSYPMVSRPTHMGGLGFSMKWNLGWMHDILRYMQHDAIHRRYHHDNVTFGLLYAFNENFILPFSHDEVVHGKGSMISKMPGDEWQRYANLRLLYTFTFTYPGKKLLFMGSEFAQASEWQFDMPLPWHSLNSRYNKGMQHLIKDLNHHYREKIALHGHDFSPQGFEWIDCSDHEQSVISYIRRYQQASLLIIFNFTPVPRENYRIGVPDAGSYAIIFSSDARCYGGCDTANIAVLESDPIPWANRAHSLVLTLPPLAGIILSQC